MTQQHRTYLIANPIYDGVFKVLMGELDIARELLSVILGLNIVHLQLTAQETPINVSPRKKRKDGSVLPSIIRLDFCAVIQTADGRHIQVLIELQKARVLADILRFRYYLAHRYSTLAEIVDGGQRSDEPLPIISIFLLGFCIDKRLELVTHVERRYINAVDGEETELGDKPRPDFIERLTHDAWFVQIPLIKRRGRTRLERVLSIFDQSRQIKGDPHRLDYGEKVDKIEDDLLQRMLSCLHKLQLNPEMERIMTAEDVFELEQERLIKSYTSDLRQELEQEQRRREEEQKRREDEQRRREESDRQREESDRQREEAEREIARLRKLVGDAEDGS